MTNGLIFIKQTKKNLEQDGAVKSKAIELKKVRIKTVNSIKGVLIKENGGLESNFTALETYQTDLETHRKSIYAFLKAMDLKARPIFMSSAQFDLIQGFLDKTYALDSVDNGILKLINPHGNNHIKDLPIDSLHKYFSRVVVDY